MGNGLNMWEKVSIREKLLRGVGYGLSIWEMPEICVKLLKYMKNDLDMLKTA